jgi:general secretion pathway protein K
LQVRTVAAPCRAPRIAGSRRERQRGSALLTVLWLSAALAAIAFSLAITVRGETERTSTAIDGLRAYYLARGGVERAALELLWSIGQEPGKRPIPQYSTEVLYHFASGDVRVEFIPEASKLNINRETPEVLDRLMLALGLDPARAVEVVSAIDDWRSPAPQGGLFDGYYSAQSPSFLAPHASFQEIEELLQVNGVTPDLFYGTYVPNGEQTLGGEHPLVRSSGLADCLSVYGARGLVDVNTANPAVLAAVGVPGGVIPAILERRKMAPFTQQQLADFMSAMGIPDAPLRVEGNSMLTIRGTARLRVAGGQLSDLRRTVAVQVKYMPRDADTPIHYLRWYDTAWSD